METTTQVQSKMTEATIEKRLKVLKEAKSKKENESLDDSFFKSKKVKEFLDNDIDLNCVIPDLGTMFFSWLGSKNCNDKFCRPAERNQISRSYRQITLLLSLLDLENKIQDKKVIDMIFPELVNES